LECGCKATVNERRYGLGSDISQTCTAGARETIVPYPEFAGETRHVGWLGRSHRARQVGFTVGASPRFAEYGELTSASPFIPEQWTAIQQAWKSAALKDG